MPMILDGGRRHAQGASHPATVVLTAVRGADAAWVNWR